MKFGMVTLQRISVSICTHGVARIKLALVYDSRCEKGKNGNGTRSLPPSATRESTNWKGCYPSATRESTNWKGCYPRLQTTCRFRSKRASIRWLPGTTLACRARGRRAQASPRHLFDQYSFRLEVRANFSGTCRACHRKGHSQCLAQVSDSQAAVEVA